MPPKFPKKFIQRIEEILPKNEIGNFLQSATEPLPKTIRISPNFSPPKNWKLKKVADIPEAFFIDRDDKKKIPLGKTLEHFSGKIYVQSLSSMLPVKILNPQPDEKILDICASPGSKTTFLAQKMENTGVVVANEPSNSRIKKLVANVNRLGLKNVCFIQHKGENLNNFFAQEFDKILLDAPCSSEAFGRRDNTFFQKKWFEKHILESASLQKKLIKSAFEILCPGGELVYSTCTSAPEENEEVIEFLDKIYGEFLEIVPINLKNIPHYSGVKKFGKNIYQKKIYENAIRIWPHLKNKNWDSEQFFCAKIKKTKSLKLKNLQNFSAQNLSKKSDYIIVNSTNILPKQKFYGCKKFKNKSKDKNITTPSIKFFKKNQRAEILTKLIKKFEFPKNLFDKYEIVKKNENISFCTKASASFCVKNYCKKIGQKIFSYPIKNKFSTKQKKDELIISSEFSLHYGIFAKKNIFEVDENLKEKFLAGFDLIFSSPPEELKNIQNGEYIFVIFKNYCLGPAKLQNSGKKLKNKLDRNLI